MGLIGDFVMLDPMDCKNGVAKGKVRFQSCPIIAKGGGTLGKNNKLEMRG